MDDVAANGTSVADGRVTNLFGGLGQRGRVLLDVAGPC